MFFRFPRMTYKTFGFMSTTHCFTLSKEGSRDMRTGLDMPTSMNHENIFCLLDILVDGFVILNQVKLFVVIILHLSLV